LHVREPFSFGSIVDSISWAVKCLLTNLFVASDVVESCNTIMLTFRVNIGCIGAGGDTIFDRNLWLTFSVLIGDKKWECDNCKIFWLRLCLASSGQGRTFFSAGRSLLAFANGNCATNEETLISYKLGEKKIKR
jgi:hypothetical protein